jgi:hypothetical protein
MKAECSIRVAYANPTMAIQFGNSIEPRSTNEMVLEKGKPHLNLFFAPKLL